MQRVEYCGPFGAVTVPEIDPDREIEHGEVIEVESSLAKRLLAQPSNWRRPKGEKAPAEAEEAQAPAEPENP
ncbi:MAG: hypothetical protein E6Q97_08220 [Desulfurellales bacterium]|nr:MAG: hypothetical protein E6Q97_08220 [Desulfurellales bacterium]